MKTLQLTELKVFTVLLAVLFSFTLAAQVGGWKPELVENSQKALDEMIKQKPKLQSFKDKSYGYAIFQRVTKDGLMYEASIGGQHFSFKPK